MLGDHWALGKFGYFDQSFHVPLIIADPRRAPAGRIAAFSESVDLMPTIIELAGGSPPGHLDGRSLVPFLDGGTPPAWRDAVHWEYDFREVETRAAQDFFGLDLDACSLAVIRGDAVQIRALRRTEAAALRSRLRSATSSSTSPAIRLTAPSGSNMRRSCWPGGRVISTGR